MENVHQLRVFQAVAQQLSFTRAAETLFITQSAVSHQIAALERSLGTPLIVREGRQISLTEAGRVLVDHARRVFATLQEAQHAVRRAARPDAGTLRIGASTTACQYLIPESLREFRESYPAFSVSITVGDTPVVAEKLLEGGLDLGILIANERTRQFTYHDLFTDELGVLVSPLHPWAKAGRVDKRDLPNQHFVLYSRNSTTFRLVERCLLKLQTPLRDYTELGSMEAIKELVKLGLGVSVVAPWIARTEIAQRNLVWLPLPSGGLRRRWCLASRAGRKLTIAEQTLLGLCHSVADQLSFDAKRRQ